MAVQPLLTFSGAAEHDPAIDRWLNGLPRDLEPLASAWFQRIRGCGPQVRELMHDGWANCCVQDAPFAYVACFRAHVNLGFFHGASLPDPLQLLEGTGKAMRHVKLKPGLAIDAAALEALVSAAYEDILVRLGPASAGSAASE